VAIDRYSQFYSRLAVPFLVSRRPPWDKFPGADYTTAIDVVMPDGKTLQVGTAHHLGSTFAKTYGITYETPEGEQKLVSQTCYGVSERCIAALISVHGDDRGLVLPFGVAPVQVVIVPILLGDKEKVLEVARALEQKLTQACIRVKLDASDDRPGAKFYKWEFRGVPIRLEVGPKDVQKGVATLARRDGIKKAVPLDDIVAAVVSEGQELHSVLYARAREFMGSKVREVSGLEEARKQTGDGVAIVAWCGSEECGHALEDQVGANMLGEPQYVSFPEALCAVCGKSTTRRTHMAKQY
jgi:prolyl-tRNA synthetase